MTEAEWLAATDPAPMLESLRGANERKLRLFACGCIRQVWDWLTNEHSRRAIEVAEQFIDMPHPDNVFFLVKNVYPAWDAAGANSLALTGDAMVWAREYSNWTAQTATEPARRAERRHGQAALLRDLFGNPFQQVSPVDPMWLAQNGNRVSKLARTIYDSRAFHQVPVLADALEDAGCDDAAILGHCRNGLEHVRGCWVLDLLLQKG
jgi:hypothetical protein